MNDEMTTKPTFEPLLERLNEFDAKFASEFAEIKAGQEELRKGQEALRKGQDELHMGQEELRADLNSGLHRIKGQIKTLNDNIFEVNADLRQFWIRLDKLEAELPRKDL